LSKLKIKDSVVTVTGGTGSFGSTMVKHALKLGASEVRVFSRDESKQDQLRHEIADDRAKFFLGDIRNQVSVDNVVRGSNLIFHAAALKQVPSCEFFPLEAVDTNVQGSGNVLRSAFHFEVDSVICLSTDKAVYPINAMGMSKALMEKAATSFVRHNPNSKTKISITRYGNVMYSRGSVIPLFISQILENKPLTVTNPEMTRFLMTLEESVDLVEHAFENSQSGDLFVKKAPAASLAVLLEALLDIFNAKDREIQTIGTRHGEKLFESLLSTEEFAYAIDQGDYFKVPLDTRGLDYAIYFEEGQKLSSGIEPYTSHNTKQMNVDEAKQMLLNLPEIQKLLKTA
jgi:UDP-N-acetylglucosamine 4,6-dehydratase/5-epimerase